MVSQYYEEAASADEEGLKELSRKCAKLAANVRTMKKMTEEEVGTTQVEQLAWKITANREAKKGNRELKRKKKGWYDKPEQRDRKYVVHEMKIRTEHARQDWQEAEAKLKILKEKLLREAVTNRERNKIKRELKGAKKINEAAFHEEEKKGRKKLNHAREKVEKRAKMKIKSEKAERERSFQKWIDRMCQEEPGPPPEEEVPMYGENIEADEDELAAMKLPLNFVLYGKIGDEDTRYESTLCNTKVRWSRRTTGSPSDQQEDEDNFG